MKTLNIIQITCFLAFYSSGLYSQQAWQWKSPLPQANNINKVYFSSANIVGIGDYGTVITSSNSGSNWSVSNTINNDKGNWVCFFKLSAGLLYAGTDNGKIYKSTNTGESWFQLTASLPSIKDVHFADANTGYALTQNTLHKTTNGGFNWNPVYTYTGTGMSNPTDIEFINAQTGFTGGGIGFFPEERMFKTTDGGFTWARCISNDAGAVKEVKFINPSTGYCILTTSIYKTTNEGNNWFSTGPSTSYPFESISAISADTVYAGNSSTLFKTTNGGINWNIISITGATGAYAMNFENGEKGIVLGWNNRISLTTNGGALWTQVTEGNGSGTADDWLKYIEFVNPQTGFITGWNNLLKKTTDSGDNWHILISPSLGHINGGSFINSGTGFIAGGNSGQGFVYKTTTGGNNWQLIGSMGSYMLDKLKFFDANTGVVLSYYGEVFRTTNSGDNWAFSRPDSGLSSYDIVFNGATGFISGIKAGVGRILKTTNYGETWQAGFSLPGATFYCMHLVNSSTGYAVGSGIYKTTNGGDSWLKIYHSPFMAGVYFTNVNTGYVTGNGAILKTTNGGINWYGLYSPTGERLERVYFNNDSIGIIIGQKGTIIKTSNGGGNFITGLAPATEILPSGFKLHQNYPNPFNPSTTLSFSLPVSTVISLSVYDVLGREVKQIVTNSLTPAGHHTVEFNGSALSSGIYFYKLETFSGEKQIITKSMVLVK
jgi:photosystem II stability/assembly factor-like uncharacterized protein